VIVRAARPDDAPALAAIVAEVGRAAIGDESTHAGHWRTLIGHPERWVAVAEQDGLVVGVATVRLPERHLAYLFVRRAAWGRGAGSALLAAADARTLRVPIDNERARRFYERRGWRDSGVRQAGMAEYERS
jgi:GNAT superfamily N-acetyltransferase